MQRGGGLTESKRLELLRQVAAGIAAQFGSGCEVVVHDLSRHPDHSIVAIFNGHVTGRKVGDGASHVVLEQLLGVVDTSCAKLSLLMRTAMGITREDYESKSLRYKIYLSSVEALEKGEY